MDDATRFYMNNFLEEEDAVGDEPVSVDTESIKVSPCIDERTGFEFHARVLNGKCLDCGEIVE